VEYKWSEEELVEGDDYSNPFSSIISNLSTRQQAYPSLFPIPSSTNITTSDSNYQMAKRLREGSSWDGERDGVEVVVLGTGCASPSPYRGNSGYLLLPKPNNINSTTSTPRGGVLLDCGEGVIELLHLIFPVAKVHEIVSNLQLIWISHHHLDHHGDLPLLLWFRSQCTQKPNHKPLIKVMAPPLVLRTLSSLSLPFQGFTSISHPTFHLDPPFSTLSSFPVKHCKHSFGCRIDLSNTKSLSFSGDCTHSPSPSPEFISGVRGSTLLIHESTFSWEESEMAIRKKHSTTIDALEIAKLCDCEYVMLTHFSHRYYPAPPPLPPHSFTSNAFFAFEGMPFRSQTKPCPSSHPSPKTSSRSSLTEKNTKIKMVKKKKRVMKK